MGRREGTALMAVQHFFSRRHLIGRHGAVAGYRLTRNNEAAAHFALNERRPFPVTLAHSPGFLLVRPFAGMSAIPAIPPARPLLDRG